MKTLRSVLRTMGLVVLMIAVTVGGTLAGALFVSPAATSIPWLRPTVAVVAALVAAAAIWRWLKPARKTARGEIASAPAFSIPSLVSTISMPSISSLSLGGSKSDRTPRAVHALAAAGTAPAEISWRTGLPVDAVALLLAMSSASRQLRPPTA